MIEITDEMVERAFTYLNHHAFFGGSPFEEYHAHVRKALDAALNPPAEPEIVVTAEQRRVGASLLSQAPAIPKNTSQANWEWLLDYTAVIYRAMRRLEPKAELPYVGTASNFRRDHP